MQLQRKRSLSRKASVVSNVDGVDLEAKGWLAFVIREYGWHVWFNAFLRTVSGLASSYDNELTTAVKIDATRLFPSIRWRESQTVVLMIETTICCDHLHFINCLHQVFLIHVLLLYLNSIHCIIHAFDADFAVLPWLGWENSRYFGMPATVSTRHDVPWTSAEIPYWWRATTDIWVVLLVDHEQLQPFLTRRFSF